MSSRKEVTIGRAAPRREMKMTLTLAGGRVARVAASLPDGDQLQFSVEGVDWTVSLPLQELFWKAVGASGKKHGLLPRTLKQVRPKKPKRKTDGYYATRYGVSRGCVTEWRKSGAPLDDPDRMGEYILSARDRDRGSAGSLGEFFRRRKSGSRPNVRKSA